MLMRLNKQKVFDSLGKNWKDSPLLKELAEPNAWPSKIDGKLVEFKTSNKFEQATIDGFVVVKWWCDEVKDGNDTECKG